jgi:hypothetical protein
MRPVRVGSPVFSLEGEIKRYCLHNILALKYPFVNEELFGQEERKNRKKQHIFFAFPRLIKYDGR